MSRIESQTRFVRERQVSYDVGLWLWLARSPVDDPLDCIAEPCDLGACPLVGQPKRESIPALDTPAPTEHQALEILRQRYARGEIDAATFDQMRERLEASYRPKEPPIAAST